MSNGKFISNRNFTLRTTTGHIIAFEKGKEQFVPFVARNEALKLGCLPVDGQDMDIEVLEAERATPVRVDGELRAALVYAVIDEIVKRNNNKDFDSGARPHAKVLSKRLGFDVSADERTKAYDLYREIKGGNELVKPEHPATQTYLEIVAVDSRKGMNDYAELLDVDKKLLEGATIEQMRSLLLRTAIQNSKA
jgi:hypothetical protein